MPKRILQGKVISNTADKTVSVLVERRLAHPIYKKFITKSKRYSAHDENNECNIGDKVTIQECRPFSKTKKWAVINREEKQVA